MTAVSYQRECQYVSKTGQVCGRRFTTGFLKQVLCSRCRKKLPKCQACFSVMGSPYGYGEGFGKKIGRYKVCGGCVMEMRRKKYLQISDSLRLLPSGEVIPFKSRDCP